MKKKFLKILLASLTLAITSTNVMKNNFIELHAEEIDIMAKMSDLDLVATTTNEGYLIKSKTSLQGNLYSFTLSKASVEELGIRWDDLLMSLHDMMHNYGLMSLLDPNIQPGDPVTSLGLGSYVPANSNNEVLVPLGTDLVLCYDCVPTTYDDNNILLPLAASGFTQFSKRLNGTAEPQLSSSLVLEPHSSDYIQYGYSLPSEQEDHDKFASFYSLRSKTSYGYGRIFYGDTPIYAAAYDVNTNTIATGLDYTTEAGFIADGHAVKFNYTIKNTSDTSKEFVFFAEADTCLEDNDKSVNSINADKSVLTMIDEASGMSLIVTSNIEGHVIVPTIFDARPEPCYYNVYEGTADPRLVQEKYGDIDSAFVSYFPLKTLQPNETVTYSLIVGATTQDKLSEVLTLLEQTKNEDPDVITIEESTYVAASTKTELVYNGNLQDVINVPTTSDGTVLYASEYDSSNPSATLWVEEVPQFKDAGDYTIYYFVEGDETHNDSPVQQINITISKLEYDLVADNLTKKEGQADPTLTYNSGLNIEGVTISREAGEAVGEYTITIDATGVTNPNIVIKSVTNGKLTIEANIPPVDPDPVDRDCILHFILIGLLVAFVIFTCIHKFVLKKKFNEVCIAVLSVYGLASLVLGIIGTVISCNICLIMMIVNIVIGVGGFFLLYKTKEEQVKETEE